MKLAPALAALILSATTLLAETKASAAPIDPMKDCPPGLVCFLPSEVGEIDRKMINLQRDLTIAKAKTKRFGLGATCGVGVSGELQGGTLSFRQSLAQCTAGLTIRIL